MLVLMPDLHVLITEMEFSYSRSSGPGGQNVNKVNSKATLRWSLLKSPSFSEEAKVYLRERLKSVLTNEGEVVISSDRLRDQIRNREDCIQKFRELLFKAVERPK